MQPKHQIAHAAIVHAENLNRENTVVALMLILPAAARLLPDRTSHEANCLLFLTIMLIIFCMMFWNSAKDTPHV